MKISKVRCGYTIPSRGGRDARAALATPCCGGRVTFAGEHTNASVDVTLQACMRGGRRAARELLAAAGTGGVDPTGEGQQGGDGEEEEEEEEETWDEFAYIGSHLMSGSSGSSVSSLGEHGEEEEMSLEVSPRGL